jgi:hypothetical protein
LGKNLGKNLNGGEAGRWGGLFADRQALPLSFFKAQALGNFFASLRVCPPICGPVRPYAGLPAFGGSLSNGRAAEGLKRQTIESLGDLSAVCRPARLSASRRRADLSLLHSAHGQPVENSTQQQLEKKFRI